VLGAFVNKHGGGVIEVLAYLLFGVVLIWCGMQTLANTATKRGADTGASIVGLGLLGAGGYVLYLVFTGGL